MSAHKNTENNIGFLKKLDVWAGGRGPISMFISGIVITSIVFAFIVQFFMIPYFDKFYTEKERQIANLRTEQIAKEKEILELKNEIGTLIDSISTIRSFGQFMGSYTLLDTSYLIPRGGCGNSDNCLRWI